MKARLVEMPALWLVGFDFFGDPFRSHGGWSAENEIGRLWQRWMNYLETAPSSLDAVKEMAVMYEVHIYHPETLQTGELEVFTGVEVAQVQVMELPLEVVVKRVPGGRYAVFTLTGEEIVSDWLWQLDTEWLPALGVQRLATHSFQRYDARFKGMDRIAESELDVYIPLAS
jgi:DNA gyrase inhibitor GyrI